MIDQSKRDAFEEYARRWLAISRRDALFEHRTGTLTARAFAVVPKVVIEIAFDVIRKSELNCSGYSLR